MPVLSTCPLHTNLLWVWEREAHIDWSMVTCQDSSTRSELPWGLLALCRRTLGSERHRYAIARPDKLGTDPMAYGDFKSINKRRRGTREDPVSKHQIQPEYGNEQADAGWDCRTRLARPNSQARRQTGNINFPCSTDNEQDWQPCPVDPYSCYMCDHDIGEKPTVILYTYINRYTGTPESHLNVMTFFSPTEGCSEGLDAFRFFSKNKTNVV